jgi:hypothetical protein
MKTTSKTRSKNRTQKIKQPKLKLKRTTRTSPIRKLALRRPIKEPTVLERIADVTEELQTLRSRLANAGDALVSVGINRITALESELEKLWEKRRHEQAAPLRDTALTEEEEKILAFPSGSRGRS